MVLEDFLSTAAGRAIYGAIPDEVSIAFELRGEGGGTWTLTRQGEEVRVLREAVEPIDCRLTCTVDTFKALVRGDLRGRQGYLDGRLEVEGDVGLMYRLQHAIESR